MAALLPIEDESHTFESLATLRSRDAWKVTHTAISLASNRSGGTGYL